MLNRAKSELETALALTGLETKILDRLIPDSTTDPTARRTISLYLIKIARLGGYLARAKDPPPGNIVMWCGLSRLNDIALGATLQVDDVGVDDGPDLRLFAVLGARAFGSGVADGFLSPMN